MRRLDRLLHVIKSGVLLQSIIFVFFNGMKRKSLEIVYLIAQMRINKKYIKKVQQLKIESSGVGFLKKQHNTIWVCWFQGMENAPDIVKLCYERIIRVEGKRVVLIHDGNFGEYTDFPKHILEKRNLGIISPAHFSDLLRTELLVRHGGIWLDATVYLTNNELPLFLENSWFFCYQTLKPGTHGLSITVSSWALSSVPDNPILITVRDILFEYWRVNEKLDDYFLFHHVLSAVLNTQPDLKREILEVCNGTPHLLQSKLDRIFDHDIYDHICSQTSVHKLTHKLGEEIKDDTFFSMLLSMNGK